MKDFNYKIKTKDYYKEKYRSQIHFSPQENWMNDPNGMVYYNGEYHLFYQYHPDSNKWGPMYWGHAVSQDMIHWKHLPIALEPDELGYIYSGSAVVDWNDSSGFFNGQSGLVAIYTNHIEDEENNETIEQQSIVYSKDKGITWQKYKGNPVVSNPGMKDFRDPKVIWHQFIEKWIMVLACGDRVRFYSSDNLKDWDYLSEFGVKDGSHGGVWECPDLFELSVDGNSNNKKWVLSVDIPREAVAGGSGSQYFIGDFDGKIFLNDNSADTTLWADYGTDFYAVQSWSDIPKEDGRRIWLAWMSNWNYAEEVPTEKWRGVMTIPREVELKTFPEGVRLVQNPVVELQKLRENVNKLDNLIIEDNIALPFEIKDNILEIIVKFELGTAQKFGLKVCKSNSQETIIGYDLKKEELFIDRSNSGDIKFIINNDISLQQRAKLPIVNDKIKLHFFLDWSSVEVFANDGRLTMTDIIFPDNDAKGVELYVEEGNVKLDSLEVYQLKSIWKSS